MRHDRPTLRISPVDIRPIGGRREDHRPHAPTTSASRPRARWTAPMPCTGSPTTRRPTSSSTPIRRELGHGLTFTNGRGTEICVAAIRALEPLVVGRTLDGITGDMRGFWRSLVSDDQLRWLGPEKGVMHLAVGAVVNAVWDLWAKTRGMPLWRLLAELPPEDLVAAIDFRYIEDALSPEEALDLLRAAAAGREEREREMRAARLSRLHDLRRLDRIRGREGQGARAGRRSRTASTREDEGRAATSTSDVRRAASIRDVLGPDGELMMDANQVWSVGEAIAAMGDAWRVRSMVDRGADQPGRRPRACADPPRRGPDPRGDRASTSRTGSCSSSCSRRGRSTSARSTPAGSAASTRSLAIILMAAKFGVPVCPHAGGVGLCEYVQHLAVFDYVNVSCSLDGPRGRVGRPPARALPSSCGGRRRSLPGAARPRLQHRDAARVARGVRIPERPGLGARPRHSPGCHDRDGRSWSTRSLEASGGRAIPFTTGSCRGARSSPSARGSGADPADPRGRGQPDHAGLLHEPQHRQRLLADRP